MGDPGAAQAVDPAVRPRRASSWAAGLASIAVAFIWAVTRIGPQTSTDLAGDAARALGWPNPGIDALQTYNRTSPMGPLLFKALPDHSPFAYVVLHGLAAVLAVLVIAVWAYQRAPEGQRFRAARLVVLGPAIASAFVSIGNYDPFTFLAIAALLFAWTSRGRWSRWWLVGAGVLLGFQHFEQTFVAVIALAIGVIALRPLLPSALHGRSSPGWALIGVVIGKAVLSVAFIAQGINPLEGRSAYITDTHWLSQALTSSVNHFPTLLMSMFAGLWVLVGYVFFRLPDWRSRLLLLAAFVLPVIVSVSTLAQTRVFVMTTLPLLMVLIVVALHDDRLRSMPAMVFAIEFAAWVIVPQHLYVSPDQGAHIMGTNALDYVIMLLNQLRGLSAS